LIHYSEIAFNPQGAVCEYGDFCACQGILRLRCLLYELSPKLR
jgi:hypothetical protein